ncbi:MAG: alcohol dehydrogenase catalytic domain-containing protein [Streptosporangiales bacterium]|nr:alcohol dehydrogenase catalytic domain-containing protein [Streptosporangiales bacterium]
MRALVYHGPGEMSVEKRRDPSPGSDEVLLRVVATGICGSDIHGFTGENGRRHPGQVMGHEFVGIVLDGGATATGVALPGQLATAVPVIACDVCAACARHEQSMCQDKRVIGVDPTISSAFADLMTVPARNLVPLPDGMPAELGALVEPLAVGCHAVARGGVGPADRVLVVGGGPIGQACYLAARRTGADGVVVTEVDAHRSALLRDIGATVVDPGEGDDVGAAVRDLLGGPADVVVDAVGTDATLAQAFDCSAEGGRIVLVGMQSPRLTVDAYAISTRQRSLVGAFTYNHREFRETAAWVGTAPPELTRLIEGRVGLAEAPRAFTDLASGDNTASKVLVLPTRES